LLIIIGIQVQKEVRIVIVHAVTAARAVGGFIFVGLATIDGKEMVAGIVYLFTITADLLDGYVARRLSVTTEFGAALDVIGDRLVTISSVVLLAWYGFSPVACGLLLVRDTVISGLRVIHVNGKPLVSANRRIGAPTAMPIKALTLALLAYLRWGGTMFRNALVVGVWLLTICYCVSLCFSLWCDRIRIREALYGERLE
jgi:phosphatidylglycerophosphate synthase